MAIAILLSDGKRKKNENSSSNFVFNVPGKRKEIKKFEFPFPTSWVNENGNWKIEFRFPMS